MMENEIKLFCWLKLASFPNFPLDYEKYAKLFFLQTIKFVSDSTDTRHKKWRNFVCKKSAKCSRQEIREF